MKVRKKKKYIVTAVKYENYDESSIEEVEIRKINDSIIESSEFITKDEIISMIKKESNEINTALLKEFSGDNICNFEELPFFPTDIKIWDISSSIELHNNHKDFFLRIDNNEIDEDFLGVLPEIP